MHKKTDDNGGRREMTPIEQIKAQHDVIRRKILAGAEDEISWQADILPHQVGLQAVWADANGQLWVMERTDKGLMLKRMWHLTG
jgi:hypothetical protein